jgi:hypothetical protein
MHTGGCMVDTVFEIEPRCYRWPVGTVIEGERERERERERKRERPFLRKGAFAMGQGYPIMKSPAKMIYVKVLCMCFSSSCLTQK